MDGSLDVGPFELIAAAAGTKLATLQHIENEGN